MLTIRIEYITGTFQEYTFRNGRAYWPVPYDIRVAGMTRAQHIEHHSTTRYHAWGYVKVCLNSEHPVRVVAIRNGRMRVLRAA